MQKVLNYYFSNLLGLSLECAAELSYEVQNVTDCPAWSMSNTQKLFGYGESNPELPRRPIESATDNPGKSPAVDSVRGGNVSRYTISDCFCFISET